MRLGEVERLSIDERLEHRLPRLGDDLAHLLDPEPTKDRHCAIRRLPDTALPRTEAHEHELRDSSLRHLAAADQTALAERAGEREGARARDQRPVEIEERGPRHASPTRGPSAACESSLLASRRPTPPEQ